MSIPKSGADSPSPSPGLRAGLGKTYKDLWQAVERVRKRVEGARSVLRGASQGIVLPDVGEDAAAFRARIQENLDLEARLSEEAFRLFHQHSEAFWQAYYVLREHCPRAVVPLPTHGEREA